MLTHCILVPPEEHHSHCTNLFPKHNSIYGWMQPLRSEHREYNFTGTDAAGVGRIQTPGEGRSQ